MQLARIPKQPKRPNNYIPTSELTNDLLMCLRDVVAHETSVLSKNPQFQKLRQTINQIVSLNEQLNKRGPEVDEAIEEAGLQTGINLKQLLNDCLRFPEVFPYVRNLQGLRKSFLCPCAEKEFIDQHGLGLCADCLDAAFECLKEKKKNKKFILYSSYSPQVRCRHADFKTLLITFNKPGYWPPAWCEICLQQEKQRLNTFV